MRNKAKEWFESLRAKLIKTIESHDGNRFEQKSWKHSGEGGGLMSLIKGTIIEKGGVNISTVSGIFSTEMQKKIPGADKNPQYWATGISVVLHPMNPNIPSIHFNTRFLQTEKSWFGGGMDITPCLEFVEEKNSLDKAFFNFDIIDF